MFGMERNIRREETDSRELPIITRIWVRIPKTRWVGIHARIKKPSFIPGYEIVRKTNKKWGAIQINEFHHK